MWIDVPVCATWTLQYSVVHVHVCAMKDSLAHLISNFKYASENNPYLLRNVSNKNLSTPRPRTELFKNSFRKKGYGVNIHCVKLV